MARTATSTSENHATSTYHSDVGVTCNFDQINSPGCYLVQQTGTLFRIPPDGLIPGRSPAIEAVCNDPWVVMKISSDPFLTLTKARMIAANLDLNVNF